MIAITELPQRTAAEFFLAQFSKSLRKKAHDICLRREMKQVTEETPNSFHAEFAGSYWCRTTVQFENEQWRATCTCGSEGYCRHAAALLMSITNIPWDRAAGQHGNGNGLHPTAIGDVSVQQLTNEQMLFLASVRKLQQTCLRSGGRLQVWDLVNLGLKWPGVGWDSVQACPRPPKDELELWNFLAYAAEKRRVAIPAFMQSITDLTAVEDDFRAMERTALIQAWKSRLRVPPPTDNEADQMELRVVLTGKHAFLQWRSRADRPFKALSSSDARRLDYHEEENLSAEASLIWQSWTRYSDYTPAVKFETDAPKAPEVLASLFSRPSLRPFIVNTDGQPFEWPSEPLRWQVTGPEVAEGDYAMKLVNAEGSPLPPCQLYVPGARSFYVTGTAIYQAGSLPKTFPPPEEEVLIPAAALESREGLEFLSRLKAELPSLLSERIRRVPLQLTFICQICMPDTSDPKEIMVLTAVAEDERGKCKESFTGDGWSRSDRKEAKRKDGTLYVYERQALDRAYEFLAELQPKWNYSARRWEKRITRNFPETFANWLQGLPWEVEVHLDEKLATLVSNPIAASIRLECEEVGIDWFDLQVVLDVSETELSKEELKLLLNARGKFVRLGEKGWRRLEYNLTEEQDAKLARLGLTTTEFSAEPQRLHALQLADDAAADLLPHKQFEAIRSRVSEIKTRVTPEVPAKVSATLRTYQLEGFYFLSYLATNRFGGILADDMGLGKTLQALTWLTWLRQQNGGRPKPVLIVCPKSVVDNWKSEAARFAPDLRVGIWRGRNGDDALDAVKQTDLFVINYAQLRAMDQTLTKVEWQAAILDEGQYIKNPDSQTAQAARALKADHRLILSGTPIENRLLDLWSLMSFAMPGMLGNRAAFAKNFSRTEDRLARSRLAARVRPFLLRRTKGEVATELPDRIEEDILCELEGEQQVLYRAELKRAQQMLLKVQTREELNAMRFNFLTSLLRLRQICCHPALVDDQFKNAAASKLEALLDLLEPLMDEGNKVLVFSQFVTMLEILRETVKARNWKHFYLAGDTENRGDLVHEFQNTEGAAVFLISLKAGGFGLNLTAASYVVLFDPWWNPAVENQAIDRTHRIGQVNKVIAYRLLIKESIEGKIRTLQKQKAALAKDILGEEGFSSSLSLEDLRYLFAEEIK